MEDNLQSWRTTFNRGGQPSIVELFPDVVDIAAEFVKQHGFAAHHRRRTETGYSSGVSIRDLRTHLLGNVKGLQEHEISLSTVRRLFEPPNKGRNSSERYKSYIEAKMGVKSNSYCEFHPDAHYLFARNKYRRELCALFPDEICLISADDMAKVKIGPLAVSRYHLLRRFYPTNDMPNFADHDFPVQATFLTYLDTCNFVQNHL